MYATQRTIDERRLVVSVPGKTGSALLQFALALFEALDKLLERFSEGFRDGNLPHTVIVFPEPRPSDARISRLDAGFSNAPGLFAGTAPLAPPHCKHVGPLLVPVNFKISRRFHRWNSEAPDGWRP